MTQAYVPPFTFYAGNGTQSNFGFSWTIGSTLDLKVYVNGLLSTNYIISGQNIVFFIPPVNGSLIFIKRVTPQEQDTDYISNDPFDAAAHEAALDKIVRMIQDYQETFSRVPQFPITLTSTYRNMFLPTPVPVMLLGTAADGTWTWHDPTIRLVTLDSSSRMAYGEATTTLLASSNVGGDTLTATALFPAGSRGVGVILKVTTAFGASLGLSTASLGDAAMIDAWGSAIPVTTFPYQTVAAHWARQPYFAVPTALSVLLRTDGGRFDAVGACRLTAAYFTMASA